MKRLLVLLASSLWLTATRAVPAYPLPQTVRQPDGQLITYVMHGDELFHYMTTVDGYLLARDERGFIRYADFVDGRSVPLSVEATDQRGQGELRLLRQMPKREELLRQRRPSPRRISSTIPLDSFRGLVILVNYTDSTFSMANPNEFYTKMLNDDGYAGFTDPQGIWRTCTGSLHEYFKDNSLGMFAPNFDVVGPVSVNYDYTFVNQTQNANTLMKAALDAADPQVDFSQYDSNNDGVIDMVYFIFPGFGSNSTGGKELWPHASDELADLVYDGKHMGHYACSTEIFGVPGNGVVEGIGTICHEFSHLLGLPDEYDTSTGGMTHEVQVPGYWSLMSMGCYVDNCLRPVGYSLLERMMAGFVKPDTLTVSDTSYTLGDLATTGRGFLLPSYKEGEFFLFENRQPVKWDANLPGKGMLAYRVDQSDMTVWDNNQVNTRAGSEHYLLLRALPQLEGTSKGSGYKDTGYDPFPGEGGVTLLSDVTSPSLRSLYGYNNLAAISDITEDETGTVSFRFGQKRQETMDEVWDEAALSSDQSSLVEGTVANWLLAGDAKLEKVSTDEGERNCITMVKRSSLTSTDIPGDINMLRLTVGNPSNASAIFQLRYSVDGGDSWTLAPRSDGSTNATIGAAGSEELVYYFNGIADHNNLRVRITEFSGVTNVRCHVGDIHFFATVDGPADAIRQPEQQAAGCPKVYDLQGRLVATGHSLSEALRTLPRGVYISNSKKIIKR